MKQIRVVIIDDSAVFRQYLSRELGKEQDIQVVMALGDPVAAAGQIGSLRPDVLVVDMEMPGLRGNEFLRCVLPRYPGLKAVVMSSLSNNVFDAMRAGAVDFVGKPGSSPGYDNEQFNAEMVQKIRIAAAANKTAIQSRAPLAEKKQASEPAHRLLGVMPKHIIAMGASTGGTEAILEVVKNFPANAPGVVMVQHMPPVFTKMYAERLDRVCPMHVREAANGDKVERGTILLAPGGDAQMRLMRDGQGYHVRLAPGEKVSGHCPSVDVLFESVAEKAGSNAVGVLLTGMGADGAAGLTKMRKAGAHTIGQNEASCIVYGMPRVAYEMGGVIEQLPLQKISDAVLRRFSAGR